MSDLTKRATDPLQYDNDQISWASEADPSAPGRRFIYDSLIPYCKELQGKDVLDIGAGGGWFMHLAQSHHPRSIYGIEPSHKNCVIAKTWYPDLTIEETNFDQFQPQQQFDLLFGLMMISHIDNVSEFFRKAFHMLRPGGKLFILTGDFDYTRTPRFNYIIDVEERDEEEYAIRITRQQGVMAEIIRRPSRYVREAEHAGFTTLQTQGIPPTPDLLERDPKYKVFQGVPIAQLMIFKKEI